MGSLCRKVIALLDGINFEEDLTLAKLLERDLSFKIKTYQKGKPSQRELFFLYKGLDHGHENFPELWSPNETDRGKCYIDTEKKRILYCPFTEHDPYENDKGGEEYLYDGGFEEALNELIDEGYQIVQITRLLCLESGASREGKDHVLRGANMAFYERTRKGQILAFQIEGERTKQQIVDGDILPITPITETTAEAYIARISVGW